MHVKRAARAELKRKNKSYEKDVEAFIRDEKKRGDVLTRAPRTEADFFPVFADLLGRLVELKEQEIDIRRAEAGLVARETRAARSRFAFTFFTSLDEDEEDIPEDDE